MLDTIPSLNWTSRFDSLFNSTQYIVKFGNGNGLSIISHAGSYGGKEGLWEVMLLDADGQSLYGEFEDGDCIIGWLTDEALKSLILDLNTKYQA